MPPGRRAGVASGRYAAVPRDPHRAKVSSGHGSLLVLESSPCPLTVMPVRDRDIALPPGSHLALVVISLIR